MLDVLATVRHGGLTPDVGRSTGEVEYRMGGAGGDQKRMSPLSGDVLRDRFVVFEPPHFSRAWATGAMKLVADSIRPHGGRG